MELIPAHMNQDELMYLDILQGGPSFDDQWQIREYSKLEPLFKDEKFIQMMTDVLDQIGDTGDVKMQFERLKQAIDDQPIEFVDAPGDSNPEIQKLASVSEGEGDNKIALLPQSVIDVLIEIVGDNKNPETGMNQFFFPLLVAAFAGSAATAAGAGLIPAVLAAGVGSYAGSRLMGEKPTFKSVLVNGLVGGLMPSAFKSFGNAFPGATAAVKGMSTGLFGEGATASMGSFLTGTAPAAAAGTGAAVAAPAAAAGTGAAVAAPAAATGLFGGSMFLPSLLTGAYQYGQAKKQQEEYEKEKQEWNQSIGGARPEIKIDDYSPEPYKPKYKPNRKDLTLYDQSGKLAYKGGGLVAGDSKGQDDDRPHKLKEGSYVVNATHLADLGDGNTIAGSKEVKRFLSKIKAHNDGHKKKMDVLLSDGEEIIDRDYVNAIGKGSNDAGAKILDKGLKSLRSHKVSNGLELPPKAYRLDKYLMA